MAGKLLQERDRLKEMVVECFRAATPKQDRMDLRALFTFKALLTTASGIPDYFFRDIHTDYVRFDFNGTGQLTVKEAYKMVKFYLYASLRRAGSKAQLGVPVISLDEAGYKNLRRVG